MPKYSSIFKTPEDEAIYMAAYDAVLALRHVPYESFDVPTRFGKTHIIARYLVPKLKDDSTLFIREPMRFISQDEIRQLMQQNGLKEVESQVADIKTQGPVYEGVFRRVAQQENDNAR